MRTLIASSPEGSPGPLTLGNAGRCESCPFSRRGKQSDDAHTEYDPRLRANTRAGRSLAAVRFLRAEANDQMQLHDAGGRDTDLTRLESSVQRRRGADGVISRVQVRSECTARPDPNPHLRLVRLREHEEHRNDRRVARLAGWAREGGSTIEGPAHIERRVAGWIRAGRAGR